MDHPSSTSRGPNEPLDITDPPPVPSPVKPTLKFYANRDNNPTAILIEKAASERFERNTGIKIDPHHPKAEKRLETLKQVLASQPRDFDVLLIDIIWADELAHHLMNLELFFEKEKRAYDDVTIDNSIIKGRLVAIPWFQNVGLLFYRKDLLDKFGLGVPKTWDDLEKAARIIQEEQKKNYPEFIGFAWQLDNYEGLTCNALEWIASWGGYDTENQRIRFGDEGVLNALDRARTWVNGDDPISPHHIMDNYQEEEALQAFLRGEAAFLRTWSNEYKRISNEFAKLKESGKSMSFGVTALPRGRGNKSFSVIGGWQLAVPKHSLNQRSAIEFIRYLTSSDMQKWRAIKGTYEPTISYLYEDVGVQKALPFLNESWFHEIESFFRPSTQPGNPYSQVSACIYKSVRSALTSKNREEVEKNVEEMKDCVESKSNESPGTPQR